MSTQRLMDLLTTKHFPQSTVKCTQEKKVMKTLLVYISNKVIWVVVNYSQAVDS